jgi:hypothetical protein
MLVGVVLKSQGRRPMVVVLILANASSCQAFDPFAAVAASESAMAGPAVS